MAKNYIALDGFTGTDVSVYKHQVIKMDEGKAAQLVADGKLAEYYNSCAIPKYDLSAMGASGSGGEIKVSLVLLAKAAA